MRTAPDKPNLTLQKLVDRILRSGQMTRQDHGYLTSMLLAAGRITYAERNQINRIFDYIQAGRLKIAE